MRVFRFVIVAVVCLAIGFVAGWQLKPHESLPAIAPSVSAANSPVRLPTDHPTTPPIESVLKNPDVTTAAGTSQMGNPPLSERLDTLRWLKSKGTFFAVSIFDADHKISSQMASLYGLTPRETEQLEQASQLAAQRLEELHRQHAQLDPVSTPEKLVVTIPPFPDEGGKVYNDLFASFSTVLGKERYAAFNEISGDQLENAFENFGTAKTRYEVSLQATADGRQVYNINRTFIYDSIDYKSGTGGTSSGTSYSTLDLAGATKSFPLLKSFTLPTAPTQKSK